MPKLRTNVLATYAGQIWMALMAVLFVPVYIRLLGIEAFGLVGFMLSLQSVSQLLDFGVGGVVNRELARRIPVENERQGTLDAVRTFEFLIWPVSFAIGATIWCVSPLIADNWLRPVSLSRSEISEAIAVIGLAVAALWPSSFYSSALSGLERQTSLNAINAAYATVRGLGVLPVLIWISPTIKAFLWWYALVGICQSLTLAVAVWTALPRSGRAPRFSIAELRQSRSFAGGLFTVTALSLILMQVDRITLSALKPLEELGYYGVAISVAAGLGRMVQPMFNAVYPRFSRLVATGSYSQLVELYHLGNQCLAAIISAVALTLILFAEDILFLWTGDRNLAVVVALPMSFLVAGSALNGLMILPYAMQLAYGWTRLSAGSNFVALVVAIPYAVWAIPKFGLVGAASIWLLANLGYVIFGLPLMHRRLLKDELHIWYSKDVFPPMMAALVVAMLARLFVSGLQRDFSSLLTLTGVFATALVAAGFVSTRCRIVFINAVGEMRRRSS